MMLVPGRRDPGITSDEMESTGPVEIAGGMAPNATVVLVYSDNAQAALEYAIQQNIAPVISDSFSVCEVVVNTVPGYADRFRSILQQANAQGITVIADSGDAGPAGCERQTVDTAGKRGMNPGLPSSIPEVTSVGGTEFNEGSKNYWDSLNNHDFSSALSYIPEIAWNDREPDGTLAVSGGGDSIIFAKPSWQTGPGVTAGNRHVPDIAFTASWDHDPYVIFIDGDLSGYGGTSAATPLFAGTLVLLNQYLVGSGVQARPGLGNINPKLYQLAQTTTGVFHDIVQGNNIIPCQSGTPNCTTGRYGYNAAPGYDMVTGVGSADITGLFNAWTGAGSNPGTVSTSLSLSASPSILVVSSSITLTASVKASSGSASPTGSVEFSVGSTSLGTAALSGSGGVATATLKVQGAQLIPGDDTITASYGGGNGFGSSSGTARVTVLNPAPSSSAVTFSAVPAPVYRQPADSDGFQWYFTLHIADTSGVASTLTKFVVDGTDFSAGIADWFGTTKLPAFGNLSVTLREKDLPVPSDQVFTIGGTDQSGKSWTKDLTIKFLDTATSATLKLSNTPAAGIKSSKSTAMCSADYPLHSHLELEEENGIEVNLTRFTADDQDLTDYILDWFGSRRLAPFGSLHADICWQFDSLPATITYHLEGQDHRHNKVTADVQATFGRGGQGAGTLSVSKNSMVLRAPSGAAVTQTFNLNAPAGEPWTISVSPANLRTTWLNLSQESGKGPAQVTVTASAFSFSDGVFTATLLIQSANTSPQFVAMPVTLVAGASTTTVITGVQNAASFKPAFAPGMLMSVYGTRLANSTKSATTMPLPYTLDGVWATVNGVYAPLWFISPGQINVQIPYETASGNAVLAVSNNGQVAMYTFSVTPTAPGIFNSSGTLTPMPAAARGSAVAMYITGDGELGPQQANGIPPDGDTPIAQLPKPLASVKVTVGGVPAAVSFAGNPWLVGVTQVNFTVPGNVPPGPQPVIVTVGGVDSAPEMLTIQ
jgi:uncharacterized protein (TIGR03437 family)